MLVCLLGVKEAGETSVCGHGEGDGGGTPLPADDNGRQEPGGTTPPAPAYVGD